MKHLYVHIPFCRSRCAYCDFASEPVGPHARSGRVQRYFEALRTELEGHLGGEAGAAGARPETAAASPSAREARLETIYLGGGTPTVVPAELLVPFAAELAALLAPAGEVTVEANPGTIDALLLSRFAEAGVTRLSLGIQSFAPALRAALGRRVSQREIEEALAAIAVTGWEEWNLDLVFGIPGETWETAAADLDTAVAAAPTHISLYDLTYTPKYLDWVASRCGVGGVVSDPVAAVPDVVADAQVFSEDCYAAAVTRLEAAGYRRYEVSNFALPGHECRHNQAYWRGEDYLGVGASAVSTIDGIRQTNPRSVSGYLSGESPQMEVISPATRLFEKAMLGLRTVDGVNEREVLAVLDGDALERLLRQGCVERRYGKLRLNRGFLDVSNAVIAALLVHPGGS